jgi:hypothetical protein
MLTAAVAAQPAGIDGVVVNRATGQPLSGVHVRLMTGDFGGGGIDRAYGAISDKAGHFSVTGMKPGLYMVMPERAGFVEAHAPGLMPFATVALKPGQNLTGHKLEMNPRAMILGRVVDEYGDPVAGVDVQIQPVPPDRESFGMFRGSGNSTDDRGEFRILTAPGKYYLQASPDRFGFGNSESPEIRSDGSNSAPYVATYSPSAADAKSAATVQASPGQDVAGIEIHLRRAAAPVRALTIAGQVTGFPEGARANVTLRFGESPDKLYNAQAAETAPDGKFSFTGLQPASYSVSAQYSSGKAGLLSQAVKLQLDNSDQTDVQLNLRPGEELTGTLELAGDSPSGASAEKRTVRLEPVDSSDGWGLEATGETGQSGAFRFTNVAAGRFHVEVEPLPDNAFIKSVTLDGIAVPDSILDFSRGVNGSRLKVTVSLNGAQISGKVLGHDGEPLVLPLAIVMLWNEKDVEPDDQNRVVNGEYSIKALRPGKYHLVAIDTLEVGDLASGDWDEALKLFKAAAQEIEVKEGDRIVKDLKALGKDDIHAK